MSNLLDKASIILTPTAYNNGEALCVKPSDGSGDFDFSRNSAATRVNAQGLVENVQILSSNLVQNGDFSEEGAEEVSNGSFSQESAELVTNGNFATDTDWIHRTSSSVIQNGTLSWDGTQAAADDVYQPKTGYVGKFVKMTITISAYSQGSVFLRAGSSQIPTSHSSVGTFTEILEWVGNDYIYVKASDDFIGSIESVSVKEVGQDWTLGTGWSIGEDKATVDNTVNANLDQTCLTSGKIYKVSFEISDLLSGGIIVGDIVNPGAYDATSNGSHTFYYTATNSTLRVRAYGNPCSITNISVKEVGQNWTIEDTWTIGDGVANGNGANGSAEELSQNLSAGGIAVGDKVKLSFEIKNYASGSVQVIGITPTSSKSANGVYEYIGEVTSSNIRMRGSSFNGSVTNISVIEITTDTNLPRINYEGFSYQDALGSEEVVNGGFDSDTAWSKGAGWSIANGEATHTGSASYLSQSILNPNTQYKVNISVTAVSGGGFVQIYMGGSPASVLIQNVGEYEYIFTSQSSIGLGFALRSLGDVTIDNVSVKEYLGQEVVPDSGCGSWLFEPQSTNLITYSEDFSSGWLTNGTITPSYGVSPSGVNNSTRLQFSGANKYFVYGMSNLATFSIYIKGIDGETINIGVGNIAAGTLHTLDGNWQRVDIYDSSSSSYFTINTYNGTARDIEVWGAQLEQQSYATSYIPTDGSSVTRNQDLCTNGGSLASINSTSGTLYAQIAALANDGLTRIISLSEDGNIANRINMFYISGSNKIRFAVRVNNSNVFDDTVTLSNILDYNKVALSFKENEFKVFINGVKEAEQLNGSTYSVNTLDKLNFDQGGGNYNFYGKTKAVAVWKEALSDQELTELTTI